QGSGPTDRNGNQPPALTTDLLRQIADILAAEGIASFRYDKRGMSANRATMPKDHAEWPGFFDWPQFVGDARAAFATLAGQPDVVPDRVGVLGHSEGGILALELGSGGEGPRPRVLVLAATPGRPLGQVMHAQLSAI